MADQNPSPPKARGAVSNPTNRFVSTHTEADYEQIEHDEDFFAALGRPPTEYLPDATQTIVSTNDSPDIAFRYSVNPYRGCIHGCAYCYARPTHEYLGFSSGLDFESKILVKHNAPALLREFLARPNWQAAPIVFSGVTDCFQPAEREFRLTRGCLEVALEARQPIGIITKNALVCRDLDLLGPMAERQLTHVNISVTTLDPELARALEPRTSSPAGRLHAIERLSAAGVPVRVMVAPIIPGLNDHEIPTILAAAAAAGAQAAAFTLLRLPYVVKSLFLDWLDRMAPLSRPRVEALIRSTRDGALNGTKFGERMRGTGPIAAQIKQLFKVFAHKHGLDGKLPEYDGGQFQAPLTSTGQLRLF